MRPVARACFACALFVLALACPAQSALAQDSVFATFGGDTIYVYGVGIGWAPWWSTQLENDRKLSLRGIASVSGWYAHGHDVNKSLVAVGVYPVLRLDMAPAAGFVPYVEGAIGFNVLSHTWIENRRLSTAFQFGEFVAVGVAFGERNQFDLGARYQHISNADIKRPNDGLSYASIVFTYRFASP
jgi:lipid A 3-O-deacylase